MMNKNNLHYIALLLLILLIAGISLANMQSRALKSNWRKKRKKLK